MRITLLTAATIILFSAGAQAATIHATVDGLVCSFCATGLEKTFKKQAAIATITVDLEHKLVTLVTKPQQGMDDATITRLISDAGYTVTSITRGN